MTTPTVMDAFSRLMADLFDLRKMIAVPTGFLAFFAGGTGDTIYSPDAETVDIDIIKGNKKTAALIPRGGSITKYLGPDQRDFVTDKFYQVSRVYPLSKVEDVINASQLSNRMAGEDPYKPATRFQRLRKKALDLHVENARKTARLHERLAAQAILTGKQDAILGTTDSSLQYDFQRNTDHIITAGTAWTEASATPIGKLDEWAKRIERNGHTKVDFVGAAGNVMKAFIQHTEVSGLADNRRYELVRVGQNNPVPAKFDRFTKNGWVCNAKITTFEGREMWLFTYQGHYENDSGTVIDLLPSGYLVMADSQARCDRYFGPPEILPMIEMRRQFYQQMFGLDLSLAGVPGATDDSSIFDPRMFYADAYPDQGWTSVTIRTWSAPIFAPIHTDAFLTVTGLAA